MKTRIPAAGVSLALALALSACADKPDAGTEGGESAGEAISVQEAVAEMKAEAVKMQPGLYSTRIQIETLEMPQSEQMPAQVVEPFKQSLQAAMPPAEASMTPEMAGRSAEEVISQGQKNCTVSNLKMDGGHFEASMVCTPEQGGQVRSTVVGDMTETRSEFRTTSELENPQMPGKMKMVLHFVTERVGDCPEAPAAG